MHLPEVPLPDLVLGIHLLGPVTREALLGGPRPTAVRHDRDLRRRRQRARQPRAATGYVPALHEIGTALVVAVAVVPQLTESVRRVRAAQALRAGDVSRVGRSGSSCRSSKTRWSAALDFAAGMDTRGYGRSAGAPGQHGGGSLAVSCSGGWWHLHRGLRRPRPRRLARARAADAGGRGGRRGSRPRDGPDAASVFCTGQDSWRLAQARRWSPRVRPRPWSYWWVFAAPAAGRVPGAVVDAPGERGGTDPRAAGARRGMGRALPGDLQRAAGLLVPHMENKQVLCNNTERRLVRHQAALAEGDEQPVDLRAWAAGGGSSSRRGRPGQRARRSPRRSLVTPTRGSADHDFVVAEAARHKPERWPACRRNGRPALPRTRAPRPRRTARASGGSRPSGRLR